MQQAQVRRPLSFETHAAMSTINVTMSTHHDRSFRRQELLAPLDQVENGEACCAGQGATEGCHQSYETLVKLKRMPEAYWEGC